MKYSFLYPTFFLTLFLLSSLNTVLARPVSYPNGWTFMAMNDVHSNSSHIHFSPSAKYSVGWRHEYLRKSEIHTDALQLNHLAKRWNGKNMQANLYLKGGLGLAYNSDKTEPYWFTSIAADWETRRLFTSYNATHKDAGPLESETSHEARFGVAPYIGNYGDIHTWLMVQSTYVPKLTGSKELTTTPLIRLFKGPSLLEAGYTIDEGAMFNFIHRF